MNIKGIDNLLKPGLPGAGKVRGDSGFQKVLDGKISGTDALSPARSEDPRAAVLDQSDRVLGLLDTYAGKLADASTSLKEMQPLVERIAKEVRLMESEAATLDPESRGVNRYLRDVSVTANVAMLKFQRGDYI